MPIGKFAVTPEQLLEGALRPRAECNLICRHRSRVHVLRVDNKKLKFRKSILSQPWHVYLTDSRLSPS